ncbi:MAG: radical SAM protein [Methanomethylophilus sp.]|jgi:biotin synthase
MFDERAADILSKGYYKERLEPKECEYLLSFRDRSPEAAMAVSLAERLTMSECRSTGLLEAQIPVSTGPCPVNCGFCKWAAATTDSVFWDIDEKDLQKRCQELGGFSDVRRIVLSTIGEMDMDRLAYLTGIARDASAKGTEIYIDSADTDREGVDKLKEAGAYGAVHSVRIGEGTDTGASPDARLATIRAYRDAGLDVITGTGPIGPEHSAKQIVEAFFRADGLGCGGMHVYARDAPPGTPLYSNGKMLPARMSQIRAVLTLAMSRYDFPKHEPYRGTFVEGRNVSRFVYGIHGKDEIKAARRRLFNAGYTGIIRTDGGRAELTLPYLKQTGSM